MLIKTQEEIKKGITTKVGSIQVPYDMDGRLLEIELASAMESFVRSMERRSWVLMQGIPNNPKWITSPDGKPLASYAFDWEGERKSTKDAQERSGQTVDGGAGGPMPTKRERSLEDSEGLVEYRCIGVFIAPETQVDIVVDSYLRKQEEKAALNPIIFGPTT